MTGQEPGPFGIRSYVFESVQPAAGETPEACGVEFVDAFAAALGGVDQARFLKHRRCLPLVCQVQLNRPAIAPEVITPPLTCSTRSRE